MAKAVMEQILKKGRVLRGSIGVLIQPMTLELVKSFGLTGQPRGALVANVTPGSPAERAGIKRGDVILDFNGALIGDSRDLSLKVSMMAPGTAVKLKVFRDGHEQEIPVTLAELPATNAQTSGDAAKGTASGPQLGISVDQLTPQTARQLGLPAQTTGVVVTDVQSASPSEEAGLRRGDVIQEVNRKPVTSTQQFRSAIQQAGSQPVLLLIDRGGDRMYVVVAPK
jgi:S1-C subfamily serine protease